MMPAAIPPVVQRALGMQNLNRDYTATTADQEIPSSSSSSKNDNNNDDNDITIRGLEGFLLPRYLSLRSGHCIIVQQQRQQNNNNETTTTTSASTSAERTCSFPPALIRAQEEELHSRQLKRCRHNNHHHRKQTTTTGSSSGKSKRHAKKRQRKRKRKRKKAKSASTIESNSDDDAIRVDNGIDDTSCEDAIVDNDSIRRFANKRNIEGSNEDVIDDDTNSSSTRIATKQHHNATPKRRRHGNRKRRKKNNVVDVGVVAIEKSKQADEGSIKNNGSSRSSNDDDDDSEWRQYQMMARIIVAPYTSSSIAIMNRCKRVEIENNTRSIPKEGVRNECDATESSPDTQTTQTVVDRVVLEPGVIPPINIYQKSTNNNNTNNNNNNNNPRKNNPFLPLSSPQESLENVVDGAVCALVRRTHRFRCRSTSGGTKKQQSNCRRRPRRRRRQNLTTTIPHNLLALGAVSHNNKPTSKGMKQNGSGGPSSGNKNSSSSSSNNDKNNWLLERNLLSSGYSLGSGDTLTSYHTTNNNNNITNNNSSNIPQHQKIHLHQCPNMAPGIHCLQPNALTSYARSSSLMRCLHSIVGDNILREMLVSSVVLVPAVVVSSSPSSSSSQPSKLESEDSDDDDDDAGLFDRGNYFQLCGPPVNLLAKKFDHGANDNSNNNRPLLTAATKERDGTVQDEIPTGLGIGRKRKRNDTENESSSRESASKRSISNSSTKDHKKENKCNKKEEIVPKEQHWDPNKIIPRGNLFYCDFYNKQVGFSPRHLLNQCDDDDDDDGPTPNNAPVVKLLNAMVQLWPTIRRRDDSLKEKSSTRSASLSAFHCNKRRSRWKRLRESGISMCREMKRRHRQCDYTRLLDRHCRLPSQTTARLPHGEFKKLDAKKTLALHVTLHTPAESVGSFLEGVLRSAFPTSFWGSVHNFRRVLRTVRVFTKLGRKEHLPEKAIVEGIRVLDMSWLLPPSARSREHRLTTTRFKSKDDNAAARRPRRNSRSSRKKLSRSDHESATVLVRNVMRWLYCKFIIPLLQSTFYITETEFTGTRVLYYRRPVWSRIKYFSMKILLEQQYREMSGAKARKLLANHNVGCPPAPLRLLPKKTGIRAIAMLSKSCPMEDDARNITAAAEKENARGVRTEASGGVFAKSQNNNVAPPNKILQSTFHALKYEHEKKPSLFGAGVLGMTEVFPSFCSFVEALKVKWSDFGSRTAAAARSDIGSGRHLYFASADIKHCYDTINQKRLYKLIRSVIKEDVYLTKSNFILHSKDDDNDSMRCRWRKHTFPPDQYSKFLATSALAEKYYRSIFVDGIHCPMEKKETIAGLLRDHIFGQVVVANGNHGQRYLLQKDGIPQGSILSSMFCNIYFGNIEGFLLKDVFEKESSILIRGNASAHCDTLVIRGDHDVHLLVRIVDDFLLISTSKQTSIQFLKKLNKGIPSLGVKINSDKSRVNYPITLKNTESGKLEAVRACENFHFPWCGLLIDTKTCEISLDYQRFSGQQATNAVLIHRARNEGMDLKKKMKDFVRPRCCQKLLFSSCVNGLDTIRLNFYQTFLLCAIKTIHYIQHESGVVSLAHQKFIYSSACDTIQFAFSLISSNIRHGKMNGMSFELMPKDALWLGRHAFFSVFQRFRNNFEELCHLFSEPRALNRKDLLGVPRRALKVFPLEDLFQC